MKKIYFTLIATALLALNIMAQDVTRFYLNNNIATLSKDSATYQIKFTANENGLINFERYCMDGKLKEKGTFQNMTTLVKEGEITTFYRNGNKKDVSFYADGLPNGIKTHYFQTGDINYKILINSAGYGDNHQKEESIKYLFCMDNNGKKTLEDGNGRFISYNDDLEIAQEGDVKNTTADGVWKGFDEGNLTFSEFYQKGKLIKGESYGGNGKIYNYQQRNKRPEPRGGINNFYTYIISSMQDLDLNNEKMMMKFVVDVNGNLKNIEVVNSSNQKINTLAVTTLKNAPKWNPALEQGKPVQVAYYMPISIKY
jgi:antitoxin component YwqK of YwqJK toxin-antitoxin module